MIILTILTSCDFLVKRLPQDGELSFEMQISVVGKEMNPVFVQFNETIPFSYIAENRIVPNINKTTFQITGYVEFVANISASKTRGISDTILWITNQADNESNIIFLPIGGVREYVVTEDDYNITGLTYEEISEQLLPNNTEDAKQILFHKLIEKKAPFAKNLKANERWAVRWSAFKSS